MKPLAPNTLLQNRYLIVQLIGKGGMGEVYLAVDQRLGSAIAIKRTYFSDDEHLGVAFEREARTLARLRHPVLPKVSDHFIENDNQYLVMEHISGDDLSRRLESNKKPFPVNWVLFWADQLLDALNYLHSHEPPIIHRDIKPQNLKLTGDNQIILLDFGLAKDSVGQTKITTTGSVVGFTPHYAPMEQIRGTGTNPKSDIYSLSATLYQLLTNTVPFDALTRADSLLNGVSDPVQPIYEINKEVPKSISDIILKGMSVSQEQRYSAAREMQKILRDAYSSMQSAMAAQTVAFNLQEVKTVEEGAADQTVQDHFATLVNEPPFQARIDSLPSPDSEKKQNSLKTEVLDQAEISGGPKEPDFDATVKIDDFEVFEEQQKQSDIKTEVFLADRISEAPETGSAPPQEFSDRQEKQEDSFPPIDATAAIIDFGDRPENAPAEKFDSGAAGFSDFEKASSDRGDYKTSEDNFSEQPDYLKTEYVPGADRTARQNEAADNSPPPQFVQNQPSYPGESKMPPPPKKSGGKGLAIAAGLFALLVLFAGAGLGGWYVYRNYIAAGKPTPTPEVSPSVAISPEITPEPTLAETNADSTNTDIADTGNTDTGNANAAETNTASTTNTTVVTTSTPRPTPAVRSTPVPPTPRQTQVVTVKTPRPTPQRKTPVPQSTPRSRTDLIKP